MHDSFFFEISLIIMSCALLSLGALRLRQPIIVAYLAGGLLCGTSGFDLIPHPELIDEIARIGITLLLFLAGIVLHPRRLKELFRQTILLTLANSLISFCAVSLFCHLWGFELKSTLFIGLTLIFSSTILVLKLVPTTALHHKRMGAYCIAILIAQDILAIATLILAQSSGGSPQDWLLLPIKGILLIALSFAAERVLLRPLMAHCSSFIETLNLLALGWCLGGAVAAESLGLSLEIGAFVAGVALARSPLAFFLSEQLKPFRDFFLVFFFFALGSRLDLAAARQLFFPGLLLTLLMMLTKYASFRTLFRIVGEEKSFAHETGARLAQASEFSLIVAMMAHRDGWLPDRGFQMVQIVTIFSMVLSSYLVVKRFPSPLASNSKLKQD